MKVLFAVCKIIVLAFSYTLFCIGAIQFCRMYHIHTVYSLIIVGLCSSLLFGWYQAINPIVSDAEIAQQAYLQCHSHSSSNSHHQ
jgi:hypothetical protein